MKSHRMPVDSTIDCSVTLLESLRAVFASVSRFLAQHQNQRIAMKLKQLTIVILISINIKDTIATTFQAYRSACRRDVLLKMTDANKKLTGTENIVKSNQRSLGHCVMQCAGRDGCISINYNKDTSSNTFMNCELIDISKNHSAASMTSANNWKHYEPVEQIGPRCRGVTCDAGYVCRDDCSSLKGYSCIDIDECASSPCQNNATCVNDVNKYSCTCKPGFTGTNCEINIDECASSPCQNDGTCNDDTNGYSCACLAGYTGVHCESDIDECQSSPCLNGGTCSNLVGAFSCSCLPGYSGTRCQTDIDECASNPCLNDGTCNNLVNKFSCTCKQSGVGDRCQTAVIVNFDTDGKYGKRGSIQQYTVPYTGTYRIKAGGAKGGKHVTNYGSYPGTFVGGNGATIQGDFHLTANTILNIIVGHKGGNSVEVQGGQATTQTAASMGLSIEDNAGTGGGGGSFVYSSTNTLYIAAGGGGGATAGRNGVPGQYGTSGANAMTAGGAAAGSGGSNGYAGQCCNSGNYHGGVGAGWLSIGGSRQSTSHGERGGGLSQGWVGGEAGAMNSGRNGGRVPGAAGGFGGGGGGSEDNGGSGGGGGYSGGGSGSGSNIAGGGGGSFCGGTSCSGQTGGSTGNHGFVSIQPM